MIDTTIILLFLATSQPAAFEDVSQKQCEVSSTVRYSRSPILLLASEIGYVIGFPLGLIEVLTIARAIPFSPIIACSLVVAFFTPPLLSGVFVFLVSHFYEEQPYFIGETIVATVSTLFGMLGGIAIGSYIALEKDRELKALDRYYWERGIAMDYFPLSCTTIPLGCFIGGLIPNLLTTFIYSHYYFTPKEEICE